MMSQADLATSAHGRRPVPLAASAKRVSRGAQAQLILGNPLFLLGWGVWFVVSIFFWSVAAQSELVTQHEFSSATAIVPGTVLKIERRQKSPYLHVHYRYQVAGEEHSGISYTRDHTPRAPGALVEVEHLIERPHRSRIHAPGMQAREVPGGLTTVALGGLGVLVALCLHGVGWAQGVRYIRRLARARVGYARVVRSRERRTKDSSLFDLTLECMGAESSPDGAARWQADVTVFPGQLRAVTDEHEEPVLYDPERREHTMLVDALEGDVVLDASGRVVAARFVRLRVSVVVALLIISGNLLAAVWWLASLTS